MSENDTTCPHCAADLRGNRILQEHIDMGFYGPPTTEPKYYSRKIGMEVRGVYDGVLFWICPDCGGTWNRWPAEDPYFSNLYAKAEREMAKRTEDHIKGGLP